MVHDTLALHGIEMAHSPAVAEFVSFVQTNPVVGALSHVTQALTNFAHNVQDHIPGLAHRGADGAAIANGAAEQGPRIVEYFAASCPHCQHLQPVWQNAAERWAEEHPAGSEADGLGPVKWEQKECFGPGWTPGRDAAECEKAGVEAFPTIKFYGGPTTQYQEEFEDDRTADGLMQFLKARTGEIPGQAGIGGNHGMPAPGARVVAYVAGNEEDCPNCGKLEPMWQDALHKWIQEHGGTTGPVAWQEKNCYGHGGSQTADTEACQNDGVTAFPYIKFFADASDHEGAGYEGEPKAEGIVNFVRVLSGEADGSPADAMAVAGGGTPVDQTPRIVDYYAASCPHCQHLQPVWQEAEHQWASTHTGEDAGPAVEWQQKECFGEGWAPGRDAEECDKAGVEAFPTIKFYGGSASKVGDAFTENRSAENIVKFVQDHVSPQHAAGEATQDLATPPEQPRADTEDAVLPPEHPPAEHAQVAAAAMAGGAAEDVPRMVEYFSKDCPHCQDLEEPWAQAKEHWSADGHQPAVAWEQKECYGPGWKPGKDYDECQREGVHSFPTVKYYSSSADKAGENFMGERSGSGLLGFADEKASAPARAAAIELKAAPVQASVPAALGLLGSGCMPGPRLQPHPRPAGARKAKCPRTSSQAFAHFL